QIADRAALHEAFGQVIGHIAPAREAQLFQRTQQFRPNAIQRAGFGEQGIEPVWTHDAALHAHSRGESPEETAEPLELKARPVRCHPGESTTAQEHPYAIAAWHRF